MANITASDVKRLREMTGVGMMDCKKALQEADGDFDAAVDLLRKKGQKVAAKRADRDAKEGLVMSATTDDHTAAVLVEVNCETDFVARNEDFEAFANNIAALVLKEQPADRDALLALAYEGGRTVGETITDLTGKIGEKIDVRRFASMKSSNGQVVTYIHPGSRLGVLVDVSGDQAQAAGRDVAMQVAAMNPIAAFVEEVPAEIREKELEVGRETARNEGRPENMLDRIAEGKLKRYYKDNVLVEQPFVKDSSMTVGDMLKNQGVVLASYERIALGE
jgi:elongation factor Ts